MTDRLAELLRGAAEELAARKAASPLDGVRALARKAPPVRNFARAISRQGTVSVIAEVKRKSPSAGPLNENIDPAGLARDYESAGAAAISVLTNGRHFGGSLQDLTDARAATGLPALRKDFITDPYQIFEARAAGADAVLLIAAALEDGPLRSLMEAAESLSLASLVEVHDEKDLDRALGAGARLVGINNRNLRTLATDLTTVLRLAPRAPSGTILVAESGYSRPEEIRALRKTAVSAVLVGESLLRDSRPGAALKGLVEAGRI